MLMWMDVLLRCGLGALCHWTDAYSLMAAGHLTHRFSLDVIFGYLVQDSPTWRLYRGLKIEENTSVKRRVSVVTSDNEPLYSNPTSVPSH